MSTSAVSGVAAAFSAYAQKVVSGTSQGGPSSKPSSALVEAKESAQVTAKEAARGDRQAIAKLARDLQKQQAAQSAPVKEPGKGDSVDHAA